MKILYGVQTTGNGHISRAIEILPELEKYATVDVFISGSESSLQVPFPVAEQRKGLCFYFGRKGGIDLRKSLARAKPISLVADIFSCPVTQYDLVISDFEPITAWAARLKSVCSVSISHQASFMYDQTPRIDKRSRVAEGVLRYYAPADHYIGVHFQSYVPQIFQPIIRQSIRALDVSYEDFNLVYLPAYDPHYLARYLGQIEGERWRIFSKYSDKYERIGQVEIFPISHDIWRRSLSQCKAVLMGAGFEGPSEVLSLSKPLMVVPMKNQYEQLCNAEALRRMGVPVILNIEYHLNEIRRWLASSDAVPQLHFACNASMIVRQALELYQNHDARSYGYA